jgi:E3 ubiquitin-protein ligase RNF14
MIHSEDKKALENEIDSRAQKLPGFNSHLIKNYDKDQVELKFKNSYFVCKVCFTDNLGNSCIRFSPCSHVFCNECMKGYFESQITSGNIKSLNCPHEKCDSQATQAQVMQLKPGRFYLNNIFNFSKLKGFKFSRD